jgi:hypothetical protein
LDECAKNVENLAEVPGLESGGRSDHARSVENTPTLSGRRDMFLDERGTGLRVSWHPERDLVVLSVWQGDSCVGTFRMPVQDIPRLSGLLAAALGDWVDQSGAIVDQTGAAPGSGGPGRVGGDLGSGGGLVADVGSGAGGTGAGGAGLSVQRRIRLSRPVLRLRELQHRRRRAG